MKQQKDWRMSCDVGEATEGVGGGGSAHSPTLPSLLLYHSSFPSLANHSIVSSTSQLIIQSFRRFIYVTACSPTLLSLHLRHLASLPWARPIPEPNYRYPTAFNCKADTRKFRPQHLWDSYGHHHLVYHQTPPS